MVNVNRVHDMYCAGDVVCWVLNPVCNVHAVTGKKNIMPILFVIQFIYYLSFKLFTLAAVDGIDDDGVATFISLSMPLSESLKSGAKLMVLP